MQKDELKVNSNQLFNPTIRVILLAWPGTMHGLLNGKFKKLIKSFKLYQKLLLIIWNKFKPPSFGRVNMKKSKFFRYFLYVCWLNDSYYPISEVSEYCKTRIGVKYPNPSSGLVPSSVVNVTHAQETPTVTPPNIFRPPGKCRVKFSVTSILILKRFYW